MSFIPSSNFNRSKKNIVLYACSLPFAILASKIICSDNIFSVSIFILINFSFVLLILGPRYIIYFYLLCIPILYIGPYALGYQNPDVGLLHMGSEGSGISIDFVFIIIFILYSFFYLFQLLQKHRLLFFYKQFIANPGAKYLLLMTGFILLSLIFQTFYNNLPISWVLRKGRADLSYLLLTFLLSSIIIKENDTWKLLKFCLLLFTTVFMYTSFFGQEKDLLRGDFVFQRLELLSMGANTGSIYLAIHIPFCMLFFKWEKGPKRWIWLAIATLVTVIGILTITRAFFVALVTALGMFVYLGKNFNKKLMVIVLIFSILILSHSFLSTLFISDLAHHQNTLNGRIERGWLPSIQAVFSSHSHFLFGFYTRNFTSWAQQILGIKQAHHNSTLGYMTDYGVPVAIIWLILWGSIFWQGIRLAKKSPSTKQNDLLTACILSLLIFFVGAHSATISGLMFLTPIFTYITIFWSAVRSVKLQNKAADKGNYLTKIIRP